MVTLDLISEKVYGNHINKRDRRTSIFNGCWEKQIVPSLFHVVCALLMLCSLIKADVKLPSIISDNMVFQADVQNTLWGWAQPGEKIEICISANNYKAVADANGNWQVRINAIPASSTPFDFKITGNNIISIHNVLVGQVWLGSGQSNMEMPVAQASDANSEINNAEYPCIRLFKIERKVSRSPLTNCQGKWVQCSKSSLPEFSAVLYEFGKNVHLELKQPVGLVQAAWGATPIEAWTSENALKNEPAAIPIFELWAKNLEQYPLRMKKYKQALEAWKNSAQNLKPGEKAVPKPAPVRTGPSSPMQPSVLYNGMIMPITNYKIRGIIWYQGETNSNRAWQYRSLFPLMIQDWRNSWKTGDMPFYFAQLANYNWPDPTWPELRQAQLETLAKVPRTGMAVTIDIGEANNIHPKNKREVGRRLALIALAKNYNKNLAYSGPLYKKHVVEGNSIIVSFKHSDGLKSEKGELNEFEIAASNGKFVPAQALVRKKNGDYQIVVFNPKISSPVSVRYAWANNPEKANLYNSADLPAAPFRTGNFDWITRNNNN